MTNPAGPGFLVVYPCGERPLASNLNFVADQTVPNFVVARLDDNGEVCVDTTATTDVIVDVAGYIPTGSALTPLPTPRRFIDTRIGLGAVGGRLVGGSVLEVPVAGVLGVPASARTVIFNATAVQPSGSGFLTVFPCGRPIPETSTLNFAAGDIVPNLVVVAPDPHGKVCFFSNVDTDLVADVVAYTPIGADGFASGDAPHRLVDTRIGLGGPLAPVDAAGRAVAVGGGAGVPADATAAIVNLTATGAGGAGYLAALPCGGQVPLVSNLNFSAGQNVANLAIVKLAADGTICLTANRTVDVVVDVLGYTVATEVYVPLTPARIEDTREGVDPSCSRGVRQAGSSFQLVDLVNGSSSASSAGVPEYDDPARAWLGPDCHIHLVGAVNGNVSATELSPSGVPLAQQPIAHGIAVGNVAWTDGGLIGLRHTSVDPPQVVDAVSGSVLFDLPSTTTHAPDGSLDLWSMVGASRDRSVIATVRISNDRLSREIFVWSTSGMPLGSFTSPTAFGFLELSPDGTYVADAELIDVRRFEVRVTTTTGAFVSSISAGPDVKFLSHPTFITDGSLLVCSPTDRLLSSGVAQRWDLFTRPRPLVDSQPDLPCLIAAG